jgi:hypothetical protein
MKMNQKSQTRQTGAAKAIKDIRRATRKQYSAEEKIRIVLDGLRGEETIAELCRREGIAQSIYYKWSKEFLEAGKRRLAGDIEMLGVIYVGLKGAGAVTEFVGLGHDGQCIHKVRYTHESAMDVAAVDAARAQYNAVMEALAPHITTPLP